VRKKRDIPHSHVKGEQFCTREEAAALLGVTYERVAQLERTGKLAPLDARAVQGERAGRTSIVYRTADVLRLCEQRGPRSEGDEAAAVWALLEQGRSTVEIVIELKMAPRRVLELQREYLAHKHAAVIDGRTILAVRALGFDVTPETLPDAVERMLAAVREMRRRRGPVEVVEAHEDGDP
jgi:hypothetical protein